MIYPQKIKAKDTDKLIKIFFITSIMVAITLVIINKVTTPKIPWARLANIGIIYIWITVMYSIKKNINIAGHVLLQTILIAILTFYIDYQLGKRGWSLSIAIPIIIIVANITMFVLTIVSYKKYIKYAIYNIVILALSILPMILMKENVIQSKILSIIAVGISGINLILTLTLSAKDVKDAIVMKFLM